MSTIPWRRTCLLPPTISFFFLVCDGRPCLPNERDSVLKGQPIKQGRHNTLAISKKKKMFLSAKGGGKARPFGWRHERAAAANTEIERRSEASHWLLPSTQHGHKQSYRPVRLFFLSSLTEEPEPPAALDEVVAAPNPRSARRHPLQKRPVVRGSCSGIHGEFYGLHVCACACVLFSYGRVRSSSSTQMTSLRFSLVSSIPAELSRRRCCSVCRSRGKPSGGDEIKPEIIVCTRPGQGKRVRKKGRGRDNP